MIPDGRPLMSLSRRSVLTGTAGLAAVSIAGCTGGGSSDGGNAPPTVADGDGGDPPLATHPAGRALDEQPRKGPAPDEAQAAIIAFEDPSCTRCRAFERDVVPRIESELVEPGRAAVVFRGYPVIYPWGEPATHALEATFARDVSAFWALKDHYYADQPRFDTDNVLDLTHEFLVTETAVDAEAVVSEVEDGSTEAAVRTDFEAGMDAGAGRTTPHLFLFVAGRYRTKAAGSVSFSVITNALGL